jgi:hypothetical protein
MSKKGPYLSGIEAPDDEEEDADPEEPLLLELPKPEEFEEAFAKLRSRRPSKSSRSFCLLGTTNRNFTCGHVLVAEVSVHSVATLSSCPIMQILFFELLFAQISASHWGGE